MKILRNLLSAFLVVVIVGMLFVLDGCGGGGGGGNSGMSYTGLTTQAIIDENNAVDMVTGAYSGASAGSLTSVLSTSYTEEARQINNPIVLFLSQILEESLISVSITSESSSILSNPAASESGTISGDCGGNASYTVSTDDVTGDFNATYIFNNYCSSGVTLSGSVNYSGTVDTNTGDIIQFHASFNNLNIISGCSSFTSQGNIGYQANLSTVNILIRDNSTGKVYKVDNYVLTFTEVEDYIDMGISAGKYYHPDHGYVVVSTNTPFRIYKGDSYPSQGVLNCIGNTDTVGGSTKARLTASSTQYNVEADTNGDGSYDWSALESWDEGCGGGGGDGEDTTPPTTPTGLTDTAVSSSQIDLSWNQSTDNMGVTGYKVYMGGNYLKSVTSTSSSVYNLGSSTQYCFSVSAFDGAGNESAQSSQVCATTLPTDPGDTEPPTVPTGLTATAVSSSQINLSWNQSTDNMGVTGYKVYVGGSYFKSVNLTSVSINGLDPSTQYCFSVSAFDGAGNESAQSSQVCATTQGGGGGETGIDLQPSYFYTATTAIYNGGEKEFEYKVRNNGTYNSGAYVIKIYLSKDDHIISGDDYLLKTINAASLAGGSETSILSTTVINPTNLQVHGNYYYIIKVDADNKISETNENNNEAFKYGIVKN